MFMQTIIEAVYYSASEVYWRLQPTAARRSGKFNKMQPSSEARYSFWNINYCVRGGHKPARWPWPTSPMPYSC